MARLASGAAGPNLSARRAGPHPAGRSWRSASDHRLRTSRAKFRQSRRTHRVGAVGTGSGDRQYRQYRAKSTHPAAARLFIDFLFSKTAQLKLREMSRIPSRSDVDSDPPRLIKGFKKVFQDIENENMSESIRLFQQTFGLSAG